MSPRPKLARFAVLAWSLTLSVNHAWSLPSAAAKHESNNVPHWMSLGTDTVRGLASPIPALLFSLPPSVFETMSWNLVWLAGAELRPFQERLSLDARLIDLTNKVAVLDRTFHELLTTEGLLIIDRPAEAPGGSSFIYRYHFDEKPRWESFWLKNLPVPSTIRPMVFTEELLLEDNKLSWNTPKKLRRHFLHL